MALANFMRLSLKKAAHAGVGCAPCRKSGYVGRKRRAKPFESFVPNQPTTFEADMIRVSKTMSIATGFSPWSTFFSFPKRYGLPGLRGNPHPARPKLLRWVWLKKERPTSDKRFKSVGEGSKVAIFSRPCWTPVLMGCGRALGRRGGSRHESPFSAGS
jgi:hypothetical protein